MLFEVFYPQMSHVAWRYLNEREDVQDVLSEAFIRVFRSINKFEYHGEGSLNRWIKTIVINESLRFLERSRKLVFSDLAIENEVEVDDDIAGDMDCEYIMSQVDELPDGYRLAFLMFAIDGYSHKEIAAKLNISVSTSKSQLFKARQVLMKKLKQKRHGIL